MTAIPYARQHLVDVDIDAARRALASTWLTTGPELDAFESRLAGRVGTSHAVALSSGTAALHALYASVGVREGTTVVVPALTFVGTAYPILMLGGRIIFADVEEEYLSIDVDALDASSGGRIDAVVVVHYAGIPADMDRITAFARPRETLVLEDAAHAIGSTIAGRSCGSLGTAAAFSFHAVKTVTTGEGGAVTTNDPEIATKVRRFRNHGIVRDPSDLIDRDEGPWHQEMQSFGFNYRLTDFQAALGRSQLDRLPAIIAERQRLVSRYDVALSGTVGIITPKVRPGASPAWHLYPIRILEGRRRVVFERLRTAGIGVQVHYLPVYRHPVFQKLGYPEGACPVAEQIYSEIMSLPLFVGLTDQAQD
ncbi:MAG: DegT/DnrJ/EryC1/StrS family aminotransferase, partial [Actinomycetota bacterium]|nr:DegT/DnrJ/EryC1/StrS family aminotransferase [Actinomycetota bacterium]